MSLTKRVTFIAKSNSIEKMKELLSAMVAPSKAEKGCVLYEITQLKDKPEKFMAIETWENEEALDGHRASSHYTIYKSSFEPYCEHKYTNDLEVLK
jgi:quinol monooxygenase YgiN